MGGRNTPAEAGKTLLTQPIQTAREKHPRRGGEDWNYPTSATPSRETPPPRRGRPEQTSFLLRSLGNTPAEAGKTAGGRLCRIRCGKHPRRGGEDCLPTQKPPASLETPPPRRGRPGRKPGGAPDDEKHPRRGGEDKEENKERNREEKHPRRGGEDSTRHPSRYHDIETPPPRRGRPDGLNQLPAGERNTPAEAGKTAKRC